tara:strand:- start:1420 stop:2115 length:696 start_codon:yes stop_codon:yes gene_type:complete
MSTGNANPQISSAVSTLVRPIFTGDYAAADEGSFYTSFLGATANTAVAVTTQALGTTSPVLVIFNGNAVGGYNLYMRYANFRITAAQTGLTTVEHVGVINASDVTHTTVGTAMSAPVNVNGGSNNSSKALLYGGVNVTMTPGQLSRIVHTGQVVGIIPIVLDSWHFNYGDTGITGQMQEAATTTKIIAVNLPPVIIPPQTYYTLGLWGASMAATAATYRMDVGFIERPSGQ